MRLAVVLAIALPPLQAAMVEPMSIEDMTVAATAVVRVRAGGASTSRSGPLVFTDREITVLETLAGEELDAPAVSFPGGEKDGISQQFAGVPELTPGGEYVLFLWRGPSGRVQVVGLGQGVFAVSSLGAAARVRSAGGTQTELGELRTRVRTAQRTAKQAAGAQQ